MHEAYTRHMFSILRSFLSPFAFLSGGVPQIPRFGSETALPAPRVPGSGIWNSRGGSLGRCFLFSFLLTDESTTCFFVERGRGDHKTVNRVICGRRGKRCCAEDVSKSGKPS
jgi:hypothetical protein